ncbi:hypothetical protein A33M_3312 [Rhodovulum sp. PH10]|uniref:hypothetical protein n=1 Tax=Rhodovulum sp. PH10 TaxID=1187851 RepID=UPI00027C27ED|nr:hypothetical protein [Rhodovulum sp. PH10]EJW11234.1 hypothetical protein A33M_3312 [Rhodovulum sp. PH10]
MNRLLALAALAAAVIGIAMPAHAAGTIPLSLSQQFDTRGVPLGGCKLYLYQAGTTTPQSAYVDSGLTIALPNPLECDASGRLPQFFLADGSVKVRLADKAGVTILAADGILVIGPSGGGGGGSTVDPGTVASTGDLKARYSTGPISGWVRANGRTIGSATSGATERANADAQALFEYLWNTDANLTVSGGRGASANADWLANKTITLPDARGRVIAGLDDMGATSAARLSTLASTTLGTSGGAQTVALAKTQMPVLNYTPAGSVSVVLSQTPHGHGITDPGHTHYVNDPGHGHVTSGGGLRVGGGQVGGGTGVSYSWDQPLPVVASLTGIWLSPSGTGISVNGANANISVSSATFSGAAANVGGSASPVSLIQPTILATIYLKL